LARTQRAVVSINPQGEVIVEILHRVGIKSSLDAVWWTNNGQGEGKGAPNPNDIKIDNWN
jgi:hypothetical protein